MSSFGRVPALVADTVPVERRSSSASAIGERAKHV
jgi:hypothetical protein